MKPTDTENKNAKKLSQLMDGEWQDLDPGECVAALCADKTLHAKWSRFHIIRDVLKNDPVKSDSELAARICSAIREEPAYTNIRPFNSGAAAGKAAAASVAAPQAEHDFAQQGYEPAVALQAAGDEFAINKSSWVNTGAAGFAVAASVALVTVVGMNLVQQQEQPTAVLQSVATAGSNVAVGNAGSASLLASDAPAANPLPGFSSSDSLSLPVVDFVANTGSFWMSPESSARAVNENSLNVMLSHHFENSPTSAREGLLPYSRLVGYEQSPSQ